MIQAIVENLKTGMGGLTGYFEAWSVERMKESATRGYDTFKGLMGDFEKALSDAIYNVSTNTGTWKDLVDSLYQAITRRFADMWAGMVFDQIASWGISLFGKDFRRPDGSENRPFYVKLKDFVGLPGTTGNLDWLWPTTGVKAGAELGPYAAAEEKMATAAKQATGARTTLSSGLFS